MLWFFLILHSTTAIFPSIECLTKPQRPPQSHNTTIKYKYIVGDDSKKLSTLHYTKYAVSNISGDHCITDCVNNYCLTENERVETCQVDERREFESPLIYYTTWNSENSGPVCFSKCTTGKSNYYWCYTGNKYEMENCNPFSEYILKVGIFEPGTKIYNDPCIDKCENRAADHEWCHVSRKKEKWINCHPNDLIYYEYHKETTCLKQECISACVKWGDKLGSRCTINKFEGWDWDYCAQGADHLGICKHCNIKGYKNVKEYIEDTESSNKTIKVMVNDPSTSITSYTYRKLHDGSHLPLVVKAIIRKKHIREPEVIKNRIDEESKVNCNQMTQNVSNCENYVFGNLVSYKHGGTGAFYNVVPLSKHLYPGTKNGDFITPSVWITNERKITNYVNEFNGVVEQNIALYYSRESPTPKAIGSYTRVLDRAVSSLLWQCENIHSNDPSYGRECD